MPVIANTPAEVMFPLVVILPVDDMSHCDVQTPTPVCAPTEKPAFVLNHPFSIEIFRTKHTVRICFKIYSVVISLEEDKIVFNVQHCAGGC